MRVAVAGGTGVVGRHVVAVLRERGHEAQVLARATGVDLTTGAGLDLRSTAAVVDVTGVTTTRERSARAFFTTSTGLLQQAGREAGVRHHVLLSIVGVDRVPFGYYRAKVAQEQAVRRGPLPWSVLRATQFHEFPGQLLARTPGPVALVPVMRCAPVAAREVAEALVDLALGEPGGAVPELAGPQEHDVVDLARRLLRARGSRRRVLGVRLPGAAGREMAGGGLLPQGDCRRGTLSWEAWLTDAG